MDLITSLANIKGGGGFLFPFDYEEIDVDGTVKTLTASKVRQSFAAEIYFELGPVRYTIHGANPTTTFGLPGFDGYREVFNLPALQNFRITQDTAAGKIRVVYYQR